MVSQSSYYAKVGTPEIGGNKLVYQYGSAKFVAKRKRVTLATELKVVKAWNWGGKKSVTAETHASGSIMATTLTVKTRAIYITRSTLGASPSGMTFWYELLGW